MSFKVSALDTKSSTDNSGETNSNANPDFEVGFADENKIQTIDLILVKLDDKGAETSTIVRADNVSASEAQSDVYVASFNQNQDNVRLEEAN